jgi:hypothetical protein
VTLTFLLELGSEFSFLLIRLCFAYSAFIEEMSPDILDALVAEGIRVSLHPLSTRSDRGWAAATRGTAAPCFPELAPTLRRSGCTTHCVA